VLKYWVREFLENAQLVDHPEAICLCKSEINRTLFPSHFYSLHFRRIRSHGLTDTEILQLLDGKAHFQLEAFEAWHNGVLRFLKNRLNSPQARVLGDNKHLPPKVNP
jgi:hypothetical protein